MGGNFRPEIHSISVPIYPGNEVVQFQDSTKSGVGFFLGWGISGMGPGRAQNQNRKVFINQQINLVETRNIDCTAQKHRDKLSTRLRKQETINRFSFGWRRNK